MLPPERSFPRVTAVALDVGHGVVVVVVLAVTHSLSLSLFLLLTCAATTVCLMVLPRCQFFSNLREQFKNPFGAVLMFFPDISGEKFDSQKDEFCLRRQGLSNE